MLILGSTSIPHQPVELDEPGGDVVLRRSPQRVRRGLFRSVPSLKDAIQCFIGSRYARRHPFVWVKTANEILAPANQKAISAAVHQQARDVQ